MFSLITIDKRGKKYTNLSLFISFVILVLLAGLREGSPDQLTYVYIFRNTQSLFSYLVNGAQDEFFRYGFELPDVMGVNGYGYGIEFGFIILVSVIKSVTANETIFFIMLAGMIIGPVVYASKRLSPYPLLSILIYFSWQFYFNLGALRHAMVSSLLILAVVFVVNNKFFKTWAIYITSVFIHKVSIFMGIVYVFKKLKLNPRTYIAILMISFGIGIFGGIFFSSFKLLSNYLPQVWNEKFYLYQALSKSGGFTTNFAGSESILKGYTIKHLTLIFVSLLYFSALRLKFGNKFDIIFGLYISSIFVMLVLLDFKIGSDRVSNYLSISEIILIPMILSIFVKRERIFILIFILSLMFIQLTMLYGNQLYYYKTIL